MIFHFLIFYSEHIIIYINTNKNWRRILRTRIKSEVNAISLSLPFIFSTYLRFTPKLRVPELSQMSNLVG